MTKAFKKGDRVNLIANWDRKGTFYVRAAIVYSCGKKQMVLTDAETGNEIGRNFRPDREQNGFNVVVPASEDAVAVATEQATRAQEHERARLNHCLTIGGGADYDAAIQKQLDALHEIRVATYTELSEEVATR